MTFTSRQDASVSEMWREITRGREWLSDVMELEGDDRFTTDERPTSLLFRARGSKGDPAKTS